MIFCRHAAPVWWRVYSSESGACMLDDDLFYVSWIFIGSGPTPGCSWLRYRLLNMSFSLLLFLFFALPFFRSSSPENDVWVLGWVFGLKLSHPNILSQHVFLLLFVPCGQRVGVCQIVLAGVFRYLFAGYLVLISLGRYIFGFILFVFVDLLSFGPFSTAWYTMILLDGGLFDVFFFCVTFVLIVLRCVSPSSTRLVIW